MRSDVNHKHAPNARPARCAPARFAWSAIVAFAVLAVGGLAAAEEAEPGCAAMDAKACVGLAMTAMGGRAKLAELSNAQLDIAQHTMLVEQSYRQEPFITSYDRMRLTLDFAGKRQRMELHSIWPEANPDTASAESSRSLVSVPTPERLELGPERLLLTAEAAPDLHYGRPEILRSTLHTVVAFTWRGVPAKVLINRFNHLPDAVETTQSFGRDFWFVWGDVVQRVYYDNWKLISGVLYPTNRVEERNGVLWRSAQVLDAKFNVALDDKSLAVDPAVAARASQPVVWDIPFDAGHHNELAPGIDLYQGAWNITFVKQDDGVVILEAPISPFFTRQAIAKARADNPSLPVKAVLSTSDSWPHFAGVREAVAEKLPVYLLDLNVAMLDRAMRSPHALHPDLQQTAPQTPQWRVVSGKVEVGSGPNRMVLYPLRGAATERQYMVYFPEHRLLYASDTLVIDPKTQALYDPELMHEVVQAVEREHLQVDRVFAMHQGPTPWSQAVGLVAAATL